MAFSRRKGTGSDSSKRSRLGRGAPRDPFEHLSKERAEAEEEEPWFLTSDDDAPELNVQAGISSNLRPEDLALLQEGMDVGRGADSSGGAGPGTPPVGSPPVPQGGEASAPDTPSTTEPGPGALDADASASVFPVREPHVPSEPPDPPSASVEVPSRSIFDSPDDAFTEPGAAGLGGSIATSEMDTTSADDVYPSQPSAGIFTTHQLEAPRAYTEIEVEPRAYTEIEVEPRASSQPDVDDAPAGSGDEAASVLGELETSASSMFEDLEVEDLEVEATPSLSPVEVETVLPTDASSTSVESVYAEQDNVELEPALETLGDDVADTPRDPEPEPAGDSPLLHELEVGSAEGEEADQSDPEEEPLRTALLQSFRDVVARAPANPELDRDPDDGYFGDPHLASDPVIDEPEPEPVRPRKPPVRPRPRF